MHHHKGRSTHGLKSKGHGKKRHGGHGRHGGHHGSTSRHREFNRSNKKVLDFHNRSHSHAVESGGGEVRGRTDLTARVNLDRCVMCGKCQRVCPAEAIVVTGETVSIDADRCIGCGQCVERCKKGALFLVERKEAMMR